MYVNEDGSDDRNCMDASTEVRRVQCSGNSTYLITLPKRWVQKLDLRSGDNMQIKRISDRTLSIIPMSPRAASGNGSLQEPPFDIEMDGKDPEDLQRTFTGAYLSGHNLFRFIPHDLHDRSAQDVVRTILGNVTGVDIIDEDPEQMLLRDLTSSRSFSFEQGVRRMHVIIRAMLKELPDDPARGSLPRMEDLEDRYSDLKRFHMMMTKQFSILASGTVEPEGISSQEALGYVLVARYLERIGRHALRIGKYMGQVETGQEIKRLFRSGMALQKLLDSAMESFNRGDFDLANDLIERSENIEESLRALKDDLIMKGAEPKKALAFFFVLDSMDRIRSYIQDIAESSINHQFVEEFRAASQDH